jgi:hypothetical protein
MQSGPNERTVREYFEKLGWTVAKLKAGRKGKAADFRICQRDDCFLCEVKTVASARANFPYDPIEHYQDQRRRRREEIEEWKVENPDMQLILHKDEYDFIYGDEAEFTRKYRRKRRNTQYWFRQFAQAAEKYFTTSSSVRTLPYILRLDSQDLYRPTPDEQDAFFRWLEEEIQAIDKGKPSRAWDAARWSEDAVFYSTFYSIHRPDHPDDTTVKYQVSVVGPFESGPIEVNVHSYGTLNLRSITTNVEKGLLQLESSASRESDQRIPRVIALKLESGIGFEWGELSSHIAHLLKENPNLSAIAVLRWTPDGQLPHNANFLARCEFYATTMAVPTFVVYHNSWLKDVKALPCGVFGDKWAVEFCPIR